MPQSGGSRPGSISLPKFTAQPGWWVMAKVYVSSTIVDLEAERQGRQLSDFRSSSDQGTGRWVRAPQSRADGLV